MPKLTDKTRPELDLEWAIAQLRHLIGTASINSRLRNNPDLDRVVTRLERGQSGLLARIDRLQSVLRMVATHDGDRWDYSTDMPEPKPSPQDLAADALKTSE